MTTTRLAIIQYLTNKGSATVNELSHWMHVTAANIRHHLGILEDEGVVSVVGSRTPPGRGRPANIYALSQLIRQHNLAKLSGALLDIVNQLIPADGKSSGMSKLATQMLLNVQNHPTEPNLSQRLLSAVNTLNQMNYQARWEARADSPYIRFGHCPYADILSEHPELCQLDNEMIRQLLDAPVEQTARQAIDQSGSIYCLFKVQRK